MDINNKNIMIISAYAADYGGNFLIALRMLAKSLTEYYKCKVYFVFPEQKEKQWLKDLQKEYTVSITTREYANSTKEVEALLAKWNINLVHCHFDAYDIPISRAIRHLGKDIKMVWHQHNHMYLYMDITNERFKFLRKIKRNIGFWIHYGYWGKKAHFIPVSYEVGSFVSHYRCHFFSFPKEHKPMEYYETINMPQTTVVPNGISLERIDNTGYEPFTHETPVFLTFGGETYYKGIPCLCDAADFLWKKGVCFEILITNGGNTTKYLNARYGDEYPDWCKVISQSDNISSLFRQCDAYISASHREGCSYAVAEATLFGLPMIQSDISGTAFNAKNPSVFLFRCGDALDLSTKMEKLLLMDKEELNIKCKESSDKIRRDMCIETWKDCIIRIYEKI